MMVAVEQWTHSYHFPCGCKSESISGPKHTRKVLSYRKLQQGCDLSALLPSETTTTCSKRTASWSAKWRRWRCRRTRSTSTCRARETRLDTSHTQSGAADLKRDSISHFPPWTLQLTQRLKTAKRQMDEAEEEIERLEHAKKKLQRELDEQIEANEQLHGQLSALRNEMRWPLTFCRSVSAFYVQRYINSCYPFIHRRKKKSPPLIRVAEDDVKDVDDFGSDWLTDVL